MKPKIEKTPKKGQALPIFDSMAACEGATGIPKAVMQQAKREGCNAFDSHSRVDLALLLRWIFRGDGEERANWPDRLKRAQALLAEMELERTKGQLVSIDTVHTKLDHCTARARAVLIQKFETELPPKLDGCPAEKIAEANRVALDEVLEILSKKETYQ